MSKQPLRTKNPTGFSRGSVNIVRIRTINMQTIHPQTINNWVRSDLSEIILKRSQMLIAANADPKLQARILAVCANDPVRFVTDWCWTTDPRNAARGAPVTVPFVLYPRQVEYLQWRRECLQNRQSSVHAKSRDSGASWLNCADHLQYWLFTFEFKGGFGSNKEIRVDRKGDPDAIFSKLRFLLKTLPSWMKPKTWQDNYMKLINDENGSVITGEAGDNIGRGGRSLLYDWDEAAYTERQESVLAALSENTDCCIRTSTPNGNDDPFSRDYQSGNFPTFSFHWKQDPRKNAWIVEATGETGSGDNAPDGAVYPWYEKKRKTLPPITLAREIDISFTASAEGVVIAHDWVMAAVNYPLVMTNYIRTAGLDIATIGKDRSVLTIVDAGNKVIAIETWQGQNTTETAHRAITLCHQYNVDHLFIDSVGVGQGVLATLQTALNLKFKYHPINVGTTPSDYYWSAEQRSSKDKFFNLRAELYHLLAQRFFKTYENVYGINKHNTDECISIPNHPTLIAQLPITTAKYAENGKLTLTPKKELKVSPDYADSLMLSLHPIPHPGWQITKASW